MQQIKKLDHGETSILGLERGWVKFRGADGMCLQGFVLGLKSKALRNWTAG